MMLFIKKEIYMNIKNNYSKLALTLAILATCSNTVFADGNAFTPLNFDDTSYSAPATNAKAPAKATLPAKNMAVKGVPEMLDVANGEIPIGNDNIQNAILELDNAQVGIRNDLLNYRAKYSDIDAQYKLIKNERNMLNKQVKTIEKRIKKIDKMKDGLRKNML